MSQFASMPMFWDVFFADSQAMSPDAAKAYLFLLGQMWMHGGSVPDDEVFLRNATRCSTKEWNRVAQQVLGRCFKTADGKWTQKRLLSEWERTDHIVTERRKAGAIGGRTKAANVAKVKTTTHEKQKPLDGFSSPDLSNNINVGDEFCQPVAQPPIPIPIPVGRKNTLTSVPKNGTAHAPPDPPPPKKKPSRVPEDFDPSADSNQIGFDGGMTEKQIMDELDNFMDYWRAKPGAAAMKLDWEATWRTWLRRAVKDHAQKSQKAFFDGTGYATRGNRH